MTPRNIAATTVLVLVGFYTLFQARFVILGPHISITNPKNDLLLSSPLVTVEGTAQNAAYLSLDDRPIFTDQKGHWSEKLLVGEGLSIIKVEAKDRFGRKTETLLRVVLN